MRHAKTDDDRLHWLRLIFEDVMLYARQVQVVIDTLRMQHIVGSVSGLSTVDVINPPHLYLIILLTSILSLLCYYHSYLMMTVG